MHKANLCLLSNTRLCKNSRSKAQRCYLTLVPAKLWHFPITARIVFSPPAVPMPVNEKLLDERQRSWLWPNTWSWELMLGIREMCRGNTPKCQPLQHAIRATALYYSFCAIWNTGFSPCFCYPRNANFLSDTNLELPPLCCICLWFLFYLRVITKMKGKLMCVTIEMGEHSAAAWGLCTLSDQVLTCKALTGPFPSRTRAL